MSALQSVMFHVFPLVIWLLCLVSFLFSLLTFDLSDLETSVDSRCTTDSADSAFICRRYWSPASSSYFYFFLQSSSSIPSHTGSNITHQAAGHKGNWHIYLFPNFLLLMFCCPSFSSSSFLLIKSVNSHQHRSSFPSLCAVCVTTVCLYLRLLTSVSLRVSESLSRCIIHTSTLQTPHLCSSVCI